VRQVLEDLQPLADAVVTFLTFDMRDETDTTCIMFIARIVQTLLRWQRKIAHLVPHLDHPIKTAALAAFQLFLRKGGDVTRSGQARQHANSAWASFITNKRVLPVSVLPKYKLLN
jgi:hypothetical protein